MHKKTNSGIALSFGLNSVENPALNQNFRLKLMNIITKKAMSPI